MSVRLQTRVQCLTVVLLLMLVIGSSVLAMTGFKAGWGKLCKKGLTRTSSPYSGMMKYMFLQEPGHEESIIELLNAIEFQLPPAEDTTFDFKLSLGWLKLESHIWITGGLPVPDHLQVVAEIMSPPSFHPKLKEILEDKESSLIEEYVGERLPARYSGIICAISLIASAVLATVLLLGLMYSCTSGRTPPFILKTAERGYIVALLLVIVLCLEYVVLAIGCYQETKKNPLLEEGFVPWPDWAWFVAVSGVAAWACLAAIARRDKDTVNLVAVIVPSSKNNLGASTPTHY